MFQQFESLQKVSKDNVDAALKSFGAVTKGVQAIAAEMSDYSKRSLEQNGAVVERLFAAKSLDKVIEVQADFVKSSYEGFVAQATKLGELYTGLVKEAYKPVEGAIAKVAPAAAAK